MEKHKDLLRMRPWPYIVNSREWEIQDDVGRHDYHPLYLDQLRLAFWDCLQPSWHEGRIIQKLQLFDRHHVHHRCRIKLQDNHLWLHNRLGDSWYKHDSKEISPGKVLLWSTRGDTLWVALIADIAKVHLWEAGLGLYPEALQGTALHQGH